MKTELGIGALIMAATAGWWMMGTTPDLPELIRVEGGSFSFGNYMIEMRQSDGEVVTVPARTPEDLANPPTPVKIEAFAIMQTEPTNALFDLFLSENGLPPRWKGGVSAYDAPDRPAAMSFDEARSFCAWLGEKYGLPMRLPHGPEWEWAARSRGHFVPWATDNGEWEPGRNINDLSSLDPEFPPPVGSFPGNPLGIQGMADGLYEWIEAMNPLYLGGARAIFKGGSDASSTQFETIPSRGISEAVGREMLDLLPNLARYRDAPVPVNLADATARCVVPVKAGDGVGLVPPAVNLPKIFAVPRFGGAAE